MTRYLIVMLVLVVSVEKVYADFNYDDFSSVTGLTLVESAFKNGSVLGLTPSSPSARGAAWFETKQQVDLGFHTSYEFRISQLGLIGADNIVFYVQNHLGNLGPGSPVPGLVVEIDTFKNAWDPNANHISLYSQYGQPVDHELLAPISMPFNASDGNVHTVDIDYDGVQHRLAVTLDNALSPLIDISFDIESIMSLDDGGAWVGFFSLSGSAGWEAHDIHSWSFQSIPEPSSIAITVLGFVALLPFHRLQR